MTINSIIESAVVNRRIRIQIESFPDIVGFVTDVKLKPKCGSGYCLSLTFASGFVYDCDMEQEFEVLENV